MNDKIARKWLKQGIHDLEVAEKIIGVGAYDTASFLAHQSVEMLLKALIAKSGKKIPRTHYVDELARELGLEQDQIDAVSELNIDYSLSRYPDVSQRVPYEEYDEEIANEKIGIARNLFKSLEERYIDILEERES